MAKRNLEDVNIGWAKHSKNSDEALGKRQRNRRAPVNRKIRRAGKLSLRKELAA
jgi:hypothetical protein